MRQGARSQVQQVGCNDRSASVLVDGEGVPDQLGIGMWLDQAANCGAWQAAVVYSCKAVPCAVGECLQVGKRKRSGDA